MKPHTYRSFPANRNEKVEKEASVSLHLKPGFILAIVANILWGASFLASKYTLQAWEPFTASSLRFGIATFALFISLKIMSKKIETPKNLKEACGLFFIGTTAFGALYPLQLAGLKNITSSFSAAIMLTSPLIVVLLGKIILKEELSLQKWIALGLGVLGGTILLASTGDGVELTWSSDFLFGSLLTLLSAASLAISVILTRKFSSNLSSSSLTLWTMAIGFLELTVAAILFEGNYTDSITKNSSLISWMSLFFLAVVCSAFCFFIWNYALSKSSPHEVASSMHIKTPTAVIIGISIGNEIITTNVIIGALLVTAGVILSQQNKQREIKC